MSILYRPSKWIMVNGRYVKNTAGHRPSGGPRPAPIKSGWVRA